MCMIILLFEITWENWCWDWLLLQKTNWTTSNKIDDCIIWESESSFWLRHENTSPLRRQETTKTNSKIGDRQLTNYESEDMPIGVFRIGQTPTRSSTSRHQTPPYRNDLGTQVSRLRIMTKRSITIIDNQKKKEQFWWQLLKS